MDRDSLLFKQGGEPGHNGVNDLQEYIVYNKHTHHYFHFKFWILYSTVFSQSEYQYPSANQVRLYVYQYII